MKQHSLIFFSLAFLLPQLFLTECEVATPPKRSLEEILKIFDEKQKLIEQPSPDAIRAKPGVKVLVNDADHELYELPASAGGHYLYTYFADPNSALDKQHYLQSVIYYKKSGEVGFDATFRERKMVKYTNEDEDGVYMDWHPNTLKPWHYYEIRGRSGFAYRKVVLDSNGKALSDQYSATGSLRWNRYESMLSPEEQEIARKRLEEKQAKEKAAAEARFSHAERSPGLGPRKPPAPLLTPGRAKQVRNPEYPDLKHQPPQREWNWKSVWRPMIVKTAK